MSVGGGKDKCPVWEHRQATRSADSARPPPARGPAGPPTGLPSFPVVCTEVLWPAGPSFATCSQAAPPTSGPQPGSPGPEATLLRVGRSLSWRFQWDSSTKQPLEGAEGPTPHWPRRFAFPTGRQRAGLPSCALYSTAILSGLH